VLVSACVISFFVAFPQLAFKSDERTLIITARGLQTTIGKKAGSMSWDDVARIEDTGGFIYIVRKNLKALIIPCRAFESHQERADFLVCILKLRSDAAAAAVA
jgi:hypothetical protein